MIDCPRVPMGVRGMEKSVPIYAHDNIFPERTPTAECLLLSVAHCLSGYFNGVGRTAFVMAQGVAAVFLVRIPFAWWASARPEPDVFTIGLASVFAAAFVLAANLVYYARLKRRNPGFA